YEVARVDGPAPATGSANMMQSIEMRGAGEIAEGSADAFGVAFNRPLHDRVVTGRLSIEGFCTWANPEKEPPPRVTLVVNGQPTMTQQAAEPLFWLDRAF